MLTARNLGLTYGEDSQATKVLADVDFSLESGGAAGIIGPSGSGKTSLLYLLAGLRSPTAGSIAFSGLAYRTLSPQGLSTLRREHFAFIFQSHLLVSYLTGIENVLSGLTEPVKGAKTKAGELLARLGVPEVAPKFPHQMSVGQRQRVAIARALIKEAHVIFADEPTASLSQQDALRAMEAIDEARGRSALLLVTHDHRLLSYCDRVFELVDGRLKQQIPASNGKLLPFVRRIAPARRKVA